ncbi:MAG: YidC/Oxa1 family membrane protein insertase [Oscillospiraceae bacterium]|nr:YidC/Oxa1 family membrane protein insertase [Candidatus Limimonas coprohippi]MCQ2488378.1 YidC/Oxa1 family membrane protein insertase [Clostridia bacterium]
MYNFFYNIFSYPFGWVLWFLYKICGGNYAFALILFTLIAKLILIPSTISTQKNQAKTLRTRSKIEKIRQKYAGDQAKMNAEIQAFYEKEGYGSMTAGCGTLLIQFPIIMGLYGAIYKPLSYIIRIPKATVTALSDAVAPLVTNSKNVRLNEISVLSHIPELKEKLPDIDANVWKALESFDFTAFGFNLGDTPSMYGWKSVYALVPIAAFLAAMASSVYSFLRTRKSTPDAANNMTMGCMLLFMPFMSLWLGYTFPIGIGVYWAINSILGLIQMIIINKIYEPKRVIAKMMIDESIERRNKEANVKENKKLLSKEN